MYHAIVRKRIRSLFDAINRGDAGPFLNGLAPDFEHVFIGNSALSGRRNTLISTREWYARLFRLLPDIRFTLHRIDVAGPPWNTLASIEWQEENTASDGQRTVTAGVHVVRLRWGRVRRLVILTDTAGLNATLDRTRDSSGGESLAAPIEDAPGWPKP